MKNSKILITMSLIFACTAFQNITAQETSKEKSTDAKFGFKGGVNFSNFYKNEVDDQNVLTGINLGVFAKLPITENFAIQPEVYFTTKGSESVYNNAFVNGTAKFNLNYVEVPVLLVVNVVKNFNIHAGPYVAFLVDGKVSNESASGNFDFENNIDTDDYNKIDAGIAAGIAVDIESISIGARYNYGLTNIGKEKNYGGTNYTFPDAKNSVLSFYVSLALN